ncbi:hypothetical protein RQP46_005398 [Phenoliferia psychrophenolica]
MAKLKSSPAKAASRAASDATTTSSSTVTSWSSTSGTKAAKVGNGKSDDPEAEYDLKALTKDLQEEWRKVAQLEGQLSIATEENRRLTTELATARTSLSLDSSAFASLDLPTARQTLALNEQTIAQLKTELAQCTEKISGLESKCKAGEEESKGLRSKLAMAQGELAKTTGNEAVAKLEATVSKMESKVITLETERANLKGEVKSGEVKRVQLAKDNEALTKAKKLVDVQLAAAQNQKPKKGEASKEVEAVEKELLEAYDRIDELEGQLLAYERKGTASDAANPTTPGASTSTSDATTAAAKKETKKLNDTIAKLRKELETLRTETSEKAAALSSEVEERKKEIATAATKSAATEAELAQALEASQTTSRERDELALQVKKLSESVKSGPESDALAKKVEEVEKERDELQARIKEFEGAVVPARSPAPSVSGDASSSRAAVEMLAKDVKKLNGTIDELRKENMALLMKLAGVE